MQNANSKMLKFLLENDRKTSKTTCLDEIFMQARMEFTSLQMRTSLVAGLP